jgi:predicted amidophosphoribosyltransferase
VREIFIGLKELVFPKICFLCLKSGFEICPDCQLPWVGVPNEINFKNLRLFYMRILLAKEGSNKKAIQLISLSLFTLIQSLTYELNLYNPINIVTIPSSGRSIMKRGRNYIDEVCIEVIKLLRSSSIHAFNTPVLNHARKVKDQSNLNKIQRFNNLENAYSLKDQSLVGGTCILMDDLITTGSSISEAIRALSEGKITILGVVTACAVERNSLIR